MGAGKVSSESDFKAVFLDSYELELVFSWVFENPHDWSHEVMRKVLRADTLEAAARILVTEYAEPDSVLTAARTNLVRETCRALYNLKTATQGTTFSLSIMYDKRRGLSGF